MSVNKYLPHLFVLPEDDANRQVANGSLVSVSTRQMYILREAGGWTNVRDIFVSDHISAMQRNAERFMVLLVDFDNNANRSSEIMNVVPPTLSDRVFVLGALSEPEALKHARLGSTYEGIGKAMASDCRDGTRHVWGHALLRHNIAELDRLQIAVFGFLFS